MSHTLTTQHLKRGEGDGEEGADEEREDEGSGDGDGDLVVPKVIPKATPNMLGRASEPTYVVPKDWHATSAIPAPVIQLGGCTARAQRQQCHYVITCLFLVYAVFFRLLYTDK